MENYIKVIPFLLIALVGCTVEPDPLPVAEAGLSDKELQLCRTWKYDNIKASSGTYQYATYENEPLTTRVSNRADLFRRKITYYPDHTYQLQWSERGDYVLGTEGDPNWQPSFGFWELEGNKLFHNPGTDYSVVYSLVITAAKLTRTSDRYMSQNAPDGKWKSKSEVEYTEAFVPAD